MQTLNDLEISTVSGGISIKNLYDVYQYASAAYAIGSAAVGAAVSANQGGSANGTDALGNSW
ncbi:MAG: hypothetical protein H7315_20905 [Herminiimonas sp.]|nr:hypothetical protein [Herminiimonas sp.]